MRNIASLQREIERIMKQEAIPGLALAVVRNHQIQYTAGFGVTSTAHGGEPVTPLTLFRIGSSTKPMTGSLVMQLHEEGLLHIDEPITRYLPWFTLSEAGAAEQITLRRLLSHTAGFGHDIELATQPRPLTLQAHIQERLRQSRVVAPPGKLFYYSDLGLNLAGCVVEAVLHQPFAEALQARICAPLSMQHTLFDPQQAAAFPVALGHVEEADGRLRPDRFFVGHAGYYPAGLAFSNVIDLAHFARMHMQNGWFEGRRVLAAESVAAMQHVHAIHFTEYADYGLTWYIIPYKQGIWRVGHGGGLPHYQTWFEMVPAVGAAVVIMWNRIGGGEQTYRLLEQIFDELLDLPPGPYTPPAPPPDRSRWESCIGTYVADGSGGEATVQIRGETLQLVRGGQLFTLHPMKRQLYRGTSADGRLQVKVGFVYEPAGPTTYIVINGQPFRRS